MTAINVIRQKAAVHILTDGAAYSEAYDFAFGISKIWPLPHLNAAVAVRGPALFAALAAHVIAMSGTTYDEMKNCAGAALREAMPQFGDLGGLCSHGPDFEVIVAGWSETQGADSYIVGSHGYHSGVAPWTVVPLGEVSLLPGDPEIHHEFVKVFHLGTSAEDLDPARDGLRIMQIQRGANIKMPNGKSALIVGAFAQLTTITPGMITTRIVHRWSDVIGHKIAS